MDTNDRRKRAGSEAADWFSRLQAGEMARAEREQFVEWLQESHIHVAEMLRITQIHGALEQFERWARVSTGPRTDVDNVVQLPAPPEEGSNDPSLHPPRSPPSRTRREGHGLRFLIAAAALVIFATAVVIPTFRGQVIETERGERREVILSDGSVLQVDPQTRLRVKYADTVRRVFLEHGRAFFRVAKNPNKPFLVQADETTVQAVGTAFGVEQRPLGVIVTVAEGKVAVFPTSRPVVAPATDTPGGAANAPTEATKRLSQTPTTLSVNRGSLGGERDRRPREVFLVANQQVVVANSGSAEPVREVDSQRALAWAEGRLIFQNDELSEAVAQFNRYNHVQIVVPDPELAARPVSGVFNAAEPEAFVSFLQSVTPVEIARDGDRSITITSARHH